MIVNVEIYPFVGFRKCSVVNILQKMSLRILLKQKIRNKFSKNILATVGTFITRGEAVRLIEYFF